MPCRRTENQPNICSVHPEHAYKMHSQSYKLINQDGFQTALEKFDLDKKEDNIASEFSEINLHLAVHDDTEKKLPPIPPTRTVRLSLREMLKEGKFKSPSKAILNRTVRQIRQEQKLKENARRRALLDKLKMRTHAQAKLNKITKFMANLAVEEREKKIRERRLEMGIPPNLKFKSSLAKIRATNAFQKTVITSQHSTIDPIKLPKIVKTAEEKEVKQNEVKYASDGVKICSSYGGFLSNKVGHSDHCVNFPLIKSTQENILGKVPTRPAYFKKEKKIKIPAHLERFRLMRIKN